MTANIAASIRQRLLNVAKERNEDFQLTLAYFALQRLIYRLTISPYKDKFVLKGAMLLTLWTNEKYRTTRDLDLLGFGNSDIANLEKVFKEICGISSPEDGLIFLADSVKGEAIREGEEYQGIRLTMLAKLEQARIPIQVDIGFGDAITPRVESVDFPNVFGLSAAHVRCYPRETIVAEKFQAMVHLGMANSRLKDFYDIWFLATNFPFQGDTLTKAIENTFARRKTKVSSSPPVALTNEFFDDVNKKKQWQAFLKKIRTTSVTAELPTIVHLLNTFLMPPSQAVASQQEFKKRWEMGAGWT